MCCLQEHKHRPSRLVCSHLIPSFIVYYESPYLPFSIVVDKSKGGLRACSLTKAYRCIDMLVYISLSGMQSTLFGMQSTHQGRTYTMINMFLANCYIPMLPRSARSSTRHMAGKPKLELPRSWLALSVYRTLTSPPQLLVYARPPSTTPAEIETVLSRAHRKDKEHRPHRRRTIPIARFLSRLRPRRRRAARPPVACAHRRRLARQPSALLARNHHIHC